MSEDLDEEEVPMTEEEEVSKSPRRSSRGVMPRKVPEIEYSSTPSKKGGKRGAAGGRKAAVPGSKRSKKSEASALPLAAAINWVQCGLASCGKWRIVSEEQFKIYSAPRAKVTCTLVGAGDCSTEDDEKRFETLESQAKHAMDLSVKKEEKKIIPAEPTSEIKKSTSPVLVPAPAPAPAKPVTLGNITSSPSVLPSVNSNVIPASSAKEPSPTMHPPHAVASATASQAVETFKPPQASSISFFPSGPSPSVHAAPANTTASTPATGPSPLVLPKPASVISPIMLPKPASVTSPIMLPKPAPANTISSTSPLLAPKPVGDSLAEPLAGSSPFSGMLGNESPSRSFKPVVSSSGNPFAPKPPSAPQQ